MSRPSSRVVSGPPKGGKEKQMNKGIFGFIGGIVTGVLLTLAAASLLPEDDVIQDRR